MEKDTPKSLVALSSFYEFTRLCERIGDEASYTQKVEVVKAHLKPLLAPGSKKKLSEEEQAATATVVQLTCGLLLCKDDRKRVYNLRDRNMAKLMARHWKCPVEDVLQDIAEGDVSETAKRFFVSHGKPCSRSTFTLQMVEGFLNKLANLTKEDDQYQVLASIIDKSTADDLKWIIRIIDKDLRIKIGPKFVLGALHPDAFEAYRNSADLKEIVNKVLKHESLQDLSASQILAEEETGVKPKGKGKIFNTSVTLMSPVKPMIASPIKSIDGCMKKCPRGMFAEIKYDGERIQIHKKGDEYAFYSRNLKKILEWKVAAVRDYITESTEAETIILDGEILLMDTKTSKPLPFGSLAIHKKNDFQDATVCLFLFDILYVDGKVVMNEPLKKRRQILEESVTSIPHRIEFSEYKEISDLTTGEEALTEMMDRVLKEGLEGLMIKDIGDVYKPDKRHWLKLKKDYLAGMADSADLVVLGAYFGTGAYGGMMSVFLMGSYDPDEEKWKTVCKAGNGFDDAALKQLQKQLRPHMKQIHKSYDKVPSWLDINRLHVPDFIVTDPEQAPVWEVAGQGFTDSKHHTTLSIRFPRVTRIRDDKDFSTHTDVVHLRALAKASAEGTSMTKAKSAAQKASGIGTLDIKGGGKPVPKAGATSTSSSSSSASAGKPKATTATATITNWMGKSKPKPAPQAKSAAATPEGLTVVKAGAGGGADLRAALVKASVSAPKAAAPADRRTLLVHCVNDAGALSADVEDRLGLLWAQSARDAWTQHAAGGDEQEAPLGEIQMAKLTKKTKKNEGDDDDGVAGKLWLVNAVTHESAKAPQSSSPPGAFSAAAFESAMGMVAAIAKVRKAVVVLALVTRPGGRGPAERAEALRIVARQLLAKKVHVVVYEMAADISDDDGDDGDDDDDDHEQQTVVVKKSTKPAAAVVRGEEEQGSGSDTEDMDDALEDLLRGKGKGKPLPTGAKPQQQTHNAAKPPAKPPVVVVKKGAAAAPMTTKPVKKEEEDGSGSDTEEMDAMDVVVVAAEKSKAKKANAVVPTREPSDSDSGTEEMDMADLKPPAAKTGAVPNAPKPKATVAGHAAAVAAEEEEEGSGSDTEEMDVEQEKANAAKAKGEIIVDTTTTTKRKRGEAAQKQVATRRKRAKREQEQSEEERRKREERRVGRLLRGVGVVVGDAVDGDAKRELAQQIEAMGGTVSQEWVPYGGRMSTHLVLVAPTAAALSSVAVKHADRLGGKVVRAEWVTDCWREKRRLSERLYYALPKHYLEDDDDDDDDDDDEDDEEEGDVSPADDESEQEEPETTTTAATKKKKKKKVIVIPSGPSASTSSSSTSSVAAVTELPSIFTGFSFYFYGHNKKKGNQFPTCDKSELERYAVAYGAEVSELVTEETTHVVSWRRDVDPSVLASGVGDAGTIKVVSPHWAWDAINTATRRPEQPYLL